MNGGFAAAYLQDFWLALGLNKPVEHRLHLCYAEIISWSGVGKAGWASQVASGGNLDKTDTGVLLVLGTQAAIEWTAILNLCGKVVWDSARFIILERVQVPVGIG